MIERPILFSGPMVRAILEGRKTQTRRVVKYRVFHNPPHALDFHNDSRWVGACHENGRSGNGLKLCPYGQPGDRLWVRETWASHIDEDRLPSRDCSKDIRFYQECHGDQRGKNPRIGKWRPSIHMPRWHARIELKIIAVRVERLQQISAKDIIAEGAVARAHDDRFGHNPVSAFDGKVYLDLRSLWAAGWNSINAKRAPWASNPWVWVVEFKLLKGAAP